MKNHNQTYNTEENNSCCSLHGQVNAENDQDHNHENLGIWPAVFSLCLLLSGLTFDYLLVDNSFFHGWFRIAWYIAAYIPVAYPVIREAIEAIVQGQIFTEFFLMSIATIGAFAIGEFPEGVAVMLFYTVGELFQMSAVKRAKRNITALLDVRPKIAKVLREGKYETVSPEQVLIGEFIQVSNGEKIPLDGKLLSNRASLNTSALTGESLPRTAHIGERVLAGSINLESVIEVEVEKTFHDSSIARILDLVQNASSKKAKTELLIRRLAKVYTPIVAALALAICILPFFIVETYIFRDWLYRALVFLVISCPCALVISIPLGYFGGLGAASKNGILFKGATYLDQITKVNTLVMDKTGTLTKGVFSISEIQCIGFEESDFMNYLTALEAQSTHPIAKALLVYGESDYQAMGVLEIPGQGITGKVNGTEVLAGNRNLFASKNIPIPELNEIVDSIVFVAVKGRYAGYVTIADELKSDAKSFVASLSKFGIKEVFMLSGDKDSITKKVASDLGIKQAKGGLLPEDKLFELEGFKSSSRKIAFVGDGINDAPVLAASDVGIAMGAMGSDVAIETADVIIQTDEPSKILTAIKIGRTTQNIIWQNIYLALGVKVLVLVLGALGMATMWQAVFADVGLALLAILNAIRIQRKTY